MGVRDLLFGRGFAALWFKPIVFICVHLWFKVFGLRFFLTIPTDPPAPTESTEFAGSPLSHPRPVIVWQSPAAL